MKFKSTRGGVSGASFADSILSGYAADRGLFVPEALPLVDIETLRKWQSLDFASLAQEIFALFVGDEIGTKELSNLTNNFYKHFDKPEILVREVGGLLVSELFHGPTFCFKDLGLQPLVGFLAYFAQQRGERRTMLVSTTGDTGPAALRAVADVGNPNLNLIVFYPDGQISELQRKQLTTCCSEQCRVVTFEGGGDDMDVPIKRLSSDKVFAQTHGLVGANSFNIGRPVGQFLQYFWTYFRTIENRGLDVGAPVDIVVPSGALGNLATGFMAKRMGLPLRRLVAGTNTNDITHRTISKGEFHSCPMKMTLASAMNIQVPYNMERIFYYLAEEDPIVVSSWMSQMEATGKLTLPPKVQAKMRETFNSRSVDDAAMCAATRRAMDDFGYLADPHTATGFAAAWDIYGANLLKADVPVAVLATASPCKFEESVTVALGAARWKSYADGPNFPDGARAALVAEDRQVGRFIAEGNIAQTQAAWEAHVRVMLGSKSGCDQGGQKLSLRSRL
eukprot:TRINITY_DN56004_c0_g1_i1.p1 TRINITY_DN56004_c0_g1~~TRINITY_DN56004_c0_g1_i1.p1  ORF type:complete len:506 (+),score=81.24 TRINITY_DN56004_c0_g1_i1:53-1570(+)